MYNEHPKRKKDQLNNYSLIKNGNDYYVSFIDSNGKLRTEKISFELYQFFNNAELEDISYMNKVSRYYEHSELSQSTLHKRASDRVVSVEDEAIKNICNENLYKAINMLPSIQKRRLILYFFYNMTYEKIAIIDGCTKRAVKFSIDIAIKKIGSLLE